MTTGARVTYINTGATGTVLRTDCVQAIEWVQVRFDDTGETIWCRAESFAEEGSFT